VGGQRLTGERVVIAAGHGSPPLAAAVAIDLPLRAERGQILVTERLRPFLPLPASGIRQTVDGTVMIGTSYEDVGFDLSTTVGENARMAARAVEIFPDLANVNWVRAWAGIRILTPDGAPIYAQSDRYPGAFVAACHSGISLAAAHAQVLASGVLAGVLPDQLAPFHSSRFKEPEHGCAA
jgi:glycine/D-amino acid oxidase-like deaminating enzyme